MAVTEITASMLQPLSGEKRWAYLARGRTIRIATLNEDSTIYLSPLWYVVHDKKIYIPVDAASRHGANAQAGRSLSALVDAGDEYATVNGVRVTGTLQKVTDTKLEKTLSELVFDKYFYPGHPYVENYFEFGNAAGRVFYELVPEKMAGWDMREINSLAVPEARSLPKHVTDRIL